MRNLSLRPALIGLTLAIGLAATPALAEEGLNVDPKVTAETRSPVEQMALAQQLYAYGLEDEDPMLIIAAARLAAGVPSEEVELETTDIPEPDDGTKAEEKAKADAKTAKGSDTPPPDLSAMIAKGRELAGDQKSLQAMLDDIEATKAKGVVSGPKVHSRAIGPRIRVRYYGRTTTYRGGRRATVSLAGNGATNLDLYVYDENGNLICKSTRGWDRESCAWSPRWTGPFKIYVVNRGYRTNFYKIWTN